MLSLRGGMHMWEKRGLTTSVEDVRGERTIFSHNDQRWAATSLTEGVEGEDL